MPCQTLQIAQARALRNKTTLDCAVDSMAGSGSLALPVKASTGLSLELMEVARATSSKQRIVSCWTHTLLSGLSGCSKSRTVLYIVHTWPLKPPVQRDASSQWPDMPEVQQTFAKASPPLEGTWDTATPVDCMGPPHRVSCNVPVSSPLINPWAEVTIPMHFEQSDAGKRSSLPSAGPGRTGATRPAPGKLKLAVRNKGEKKPTIPALGRSAGLPKIPIRVRTIPLNQEWCSDGQCLPRGRLASPLFVACTTA